MVKSGSGPPRTGGSAATITLLCESPERVLWTDESTCSLQHRRRGQPARGQPDQRDRRLPAPRRPARGPAPVAGEAEGGARHLGSARNAHVRQGQPPDRHSGGARRGGPKQNFPWLSIRVGRSHFLGARKTWPPFSWLLAWPCLDAETGATPGWSARTPDPFSSSTVVR